MTSVLDSPPPDFRLLRFTSEMLPRSDRFDLWRDVLTRKLLRVAIDPISDRPFEADAMLRSQHGLTLGMGDIGPTINHRTNEIVARDNDDLVLMANLHGPFVVERDDGPLDLGPGDATVVSCSETGRYIRPDNGRLLCVRVSRRAVSAFLPDPEDQVGRLIPGEQDALRLLVAYASALCGADDVATAPQLSRLIVDHLCDLVALTLGARGEAAEVAKNRGARAARLKAVKACIENSIGPNEFSVDDVAAEVGVSPRYVRKLLESEGLSFSGYVTERRLQRACNMLTSPRSMGLSISSIAFEVGFGDLSYFNRAFRRRFDRTPSEVRAEGI